MPCCHEYNPARRLDPPCQGRGSGDEVLCHRVTFTTFNDTAIVIREDNDWLPQQGRLKKAFTQTETAEHGKNTSCTNGQKSRNFLNCCPVSYWRWELYYSPCCLGCSPAGMCGSGGVCSSNNVRAIEGTRLNRRIPILYSAMPA